MAAAGLVLLVAAGFLALRLEPEAGVGTLAGDGSPASKPTKELHRQFGEEPILILVQGSEDQGRLPGAAADGGPEADARPRGLPLRQPAARAPRHRPRSAGSWHARKPIQVVYGPGTFINESARQIAVRFNAERARGRREADKAAEAARKVAAAQGKSPAEQDSLAAQARSLALAQSFQDALGLALRYGLSRVPQLNDPDFVLRLVFEPSLGFATPKPRFAYLFPTGPTALIQARLRPGLSDSEQRRGDRRSCARRSRAAPFRLERGDYLVSGEPVVEQAVEDDLPGALWLMLAAGVLLVGAALIAVTRSLRRPASFGCPSWSAALLAFAALSLLGGSLTLGAVAALPVMLGVGAAGVTLLAGRTRCRGPAPGPAHRGCDRRDRLRDAAGVAGAAGAQLRRAGGRRRAAVGGGRRTASDRAFACRRGRGRSRAAAPASPACRCCSALPGSRSSAAAKLLGLALRRPRRVLALALVVAVAGGVLSTRTDVVSGTDRLAAADLPEVEGRRGR